MELKSPVDVTASEIETLKLENRTLRSALQAQQALLDGALEEAAACREALMRIQQNQRDDHAEHIFSSELRDDVCSLGRPPMLDGTQGGVVRYAPLMTPSRLNSRPTLGTTDSRQQRFLSSSSRSGFETPLFSNSISSSATKASGPVAMPSKPDRLDGPRSFTSQSFISSTPSSLVNEAMSSSSSTTVTVPKTNPVPSPRYVPAPLQTITPSQTISAVSADREGPIAPPPPRTPSRAEGLHSSPLNLYLPYNWPSTAESISTTKRTVMPINDSVAQRLTPVNNKEQEPSRPLLLSSKRLGRN
jgi:hypothetical protein